MLFTAEVRWFYPGEIPAEVRTWFADGAGPLEEQPSRVDEYLLIRQTDGLNVKLREGRLEVKQRYGQGRERSFTGGSVGTVELWRKWGFSLDRKSLNGTLDETDDAWLAVRKDRAVRSYALAPDGMVIPVSGSTPVEQGCSLELTKVDAAGERWWSLSFEAVGAARMLEEILVAVADQILPTSGGFRLAAPTSCGYPAWLQRFVLPAPAI